MKYSIVCLLVAGSCGVKAWTVPQHGKDVVKTVQKTGWIPAAVTAFTLATAPIANANELSNVNPPSLNMDQSTILVAAGAYQAEDSYFSTDLSLPTYNTDNSNDLVGASKSAEPQQAKPKKAKVEKKKAPPKEESAEQAAAREAKEAKAAAKAEEQAKAKYEKEMVAYKRKLADQEKAAAMKAEKAALQAQRNEYKNK